MITLKCHKCTWESSGYDPATMKTEYYSHLNAHEEDPHNGASFMPESSETMIDEGVHYEASLDKVRIAYACYHDDYKVKGRTTEQWWCIRDKAKAEFDDWFRQQMADAWDEGYRDGHNDGLSDGHPLFNDREPEENPYRKQEEA